MWVFRDLAQIFRAAIVTCTWLRVLILIWRGLLKSMRERSRPFELVVGEDRARRWSLLRSFRKHQSRAPCDRSTRTAYIATTLRPLSIEKQRNLNISKPQGSIFVSRTSLPNKVPGRYLTAYQRITFYLILGKRSWTGDNMAGFGRSNSLSINTGGGLLYVSHERLALS